MSDFCLTPNEQFYSHTMTRTIYILWDDDDDDFHFVVDRHAEMDVYTVTSLKHQSAGRHVDPLAETTLILRHSVFDIIPLISPETASTYLYTHASC